MAYERWQSNASNNPWNAPEKFSIGYPQAGDLLTNQQPTHPGYWWIDSMVAEIRAVISAAGLVYNPLDNTQLLIAIQSITFPSFELREDGGFELREDGSFEQRQ